MASFQVLVEVAETFHLASSPPDQAVYFAAVNCWLPRSDCVKEFNGASEDVKKKHKTAIAEYFYCNRRRHILYGVRSSGCNLFETFLRN